MKEVDIKLLQWNARSVLANKGSLENYLYKNEIHIASLSETWLKPGQNVTFKDYQVIREDNVNGYRGVALLVKKGIPVLHFRDFHRINDVMCIGCKVKTVNNKYLTVISLYNPPQNYVTQQSWENFFNSVPKPFIICGDFNSHNQTWGCSLNDGSGHRLLDAVNETGLIILNDGTPTLIGRPNNNRSAVDLTICTTDISLCSKWSLIQEPLGSDHLPINITIQKISNLTTNISSVKWNTKKANWAHFEEEMKRTSELMVTPRYEEFVNTLNNSASKSIPTRKNPKSNNRQHHWWNEECQNAVNLRKQLYDDYRRNTNFNNYIQYKRQDARTKQIIKKAKRRSWREYCGTLNRNVPLTDVWKKVKCLKTGIPKNAPLIKDYWTEDFLDKIAPPSVTNEEHNPRVLMLQENHFLTTEFKMEELDLALTYAKNSSPGMDQIQYAMLYHLPHEARKKLLYIYNSIWQKGIFPESWKNYLICPILKNNKPHGDPESYRPISLASCLLKVLEKMVKNRLQWWLETEKKIPKGQFGFRQNKSTLDNLTSLILDIYHSFTDNMFLTAIFLDISGAYDNVQLNILHIRMMEIGIPPSFSQRILLLYTDRNIYLKVNNEIIGPRRTSLGLPQGGILSPLLYILYVADIEKILGPHTKVLQYADDMTFYTASKDINLNHHRLSNALTEFHNWTQHTGLTLSQTKTKVVTFARRRTDLPSNIKLGPYELPYEKVVKFLGIYLDQKLLWKEQIEYIVAKMEKRVNLLRSVNGTNWGADPSVSLTFYRTYIRSIVDYGCFFFGDACKTLLNKIKIVQNKCLRICMGYLRSTPTVVMYAETCELPIEYRIQYLSDKYILKKYSTNNEIYLKIHFMSLQVQTARYWIKKRSPVLVSSCMENIDKLEEVHYNDKSPVYDTNYSDLLTLPQVSTDTIRTSGQPDLTITTFTHDLNTKWQNYLVLYTDGSKQKEGTGCAFYDDINQTYTRIKLSNMFSIYSAEQIAIIEALKYIQDIDKNNFIIFTDSLSTVRQLENTKKSQITNLAAGILKELGKCREQNKKVIIAWIKSHIGIYGNEKVDMLAKQACTEGEDSLYKVPHTDYTRQIRSRLRRSFEQDFSTSEKGKYYKSLHPSLPSIPWFRKTKQKTCKSFVRIISRIRSGHCQTNAYKYKINMADSSTCDNCQEEETIQHLILECREYAEERNRLLSKLYKEKLQYPFNLEYLLNLNNVFIYSHLYEFIKEIKINL